MKILFNISDNFWDTYYIENSFFFSFNFLCYATDFLNIR